jgi:hypothetical protein
MLHTTTTAAHPHSLLIGNNTFSNQYKDFCTHLYIGMELSLTSDVYSPNVDETGNYIDKIPSFNNHKSGISCPCGSRKDKVYASASMFSCHMKTKSHQTWLASLNTNKANHLVENASMKELIHNQRMIIAKLEKDIHVKIMTIDCLTQLLSKISQSDNSAISTTSTSECTTAKSDNIFNNLIDFD